MKPKWGWIGLLLLWPALALLAQAQITPRGPVALGASLGAGAGVLLWRWGVGEQFRLRIWLPLLALIWLALSGVLHALVAWTPLAQSAPDLWVLLPQTLQAGLGFTAMVAALRMLSWRCPPLAVLEVAVAGSYFVSALAGHRDGHINRPFDVVDIFWLRGIDPTPIFLAVGVAALLALLLLAMQHPNNRRPWWDVPLLFVTVFALLMVLPNPSSKRFFERFGMGNKDGEENRLRPEGLPTPTQGKGKNNGGQSSKPDSGQSKPKDEPSFADTRPEPKPQPVAIVVFRDDVEPVFKTYYFRQSAHSLFNGLKLIRSNDVRFDRDVADGFPSRTREQGKADTLGLQVMPMQEASSKEISTRVALLSQHPRPFGLNNALTYWSAGNPDPSRFQKAYDVDSRIYQGTIPDLMKAQVGQSDWDESAWKHYLDGPKDKRYRELAEKILLELPESRRKSPIYRALAIKLWLDKNCTYSLNSPSAKAADPVSDFLFGERIGYCVFTSHSACYLYRAAGIPARIAEGYAVPAAQRAGGSSLLVRTNNAHSWPEVCLQGVGWLELDIWPEKNLEPESEPLDNNLQQMMGDMARKNKKENRPEDTRPRIDLVELFRKLLQTALGAVLVGLALGLTALWSWKLFRRQRPWFVAGRSLSRAAYLRMLDQLCEIGYVRRRDESHEAFARRLSEQVPELTTLARLHLRTRLSDKPAPDPEQVRQSLRLCLQQIKQLKPALLRRLLGLLDPSIPLRIR